MMQCVTTAARLEMDGKSRCRRSSPPRDLGRECPPPAREPAAADLVLRAPNPASRLRPGCQLVDGNLTGRVPQSVRFLAVVEFGTQWARAPSEASLRRPAPCIDLRERGIDS